MTTETKDTTITTEATEKKVRKPRAAKPKAKKATKKTAKPRAEGKERLVPAKLEEYVFDKEHKTPAGNVSVHCGDKAAKLLLGKSLDDAYAIAVRELTKAGIGEVKVGKTEIKVSVPALKKAYAHLNVGMQRMNLGNRIRSCFAE